MCPLLSELLSLVKHRPEYVNLCVKYITNYKIDLKWIHLSYIIYPVSPAFSDTFWLEGRFPSQNLRSPCWFRLRKPSFPGRKCCVSSHRSHWGGPRWPHQTASACTTSRKVGVLLQEAVCPGTEFEEVFLQVFPPKSWAKKGCVGFSRLNLLRLIRCDVYQLRGNGSFFANYIFIGVLDIPGCCFWISFINGIAHGYWFPIKWTISFVQETFTESFGCFSGNDGNGHHRK